MNTLTTPDNELMKIADAAFLSDEIPGHLRPWKSAEQWEYHAPARLIIAREIERALLARKQQTTAELNDFLAGESLAFQECAGNNERAGNTGAASVALRASEILDRAMAMLAMLARMPQAERAAGCCQFTDEQLQAAIDEALLSSDQHAISTIGSSLSWQDQPKTRLDLARALLASLPEPLPPVVEGKTPGMLYTEMLCESEPDEYYTWDELTEDQRIAKERILSAVLAAFGRSGIDAAIARMEAILPGMLAECFDAEHIVSMGALERVKARLITAVRGEEGQPADSQELYHNAMDELRGKREALNRLRAQHNQTLDALTGFVVLWQQWPNVSAHQMQEASKTAKAILGEYQPAAVDWKAKCEEAQKALDEMKLSKMLYGRVCDALGIENNILGHVKKIEARAEKAEELAAIEKRKRLYAEEQLGILAKTFGYEGRTWCNMVSYLCPRLKNAEVFISDLERKNANQKLWFEDVGKILGVETDSVTLIKKKTAEETKARADLANAKLPRLRPLAEAGPVPEGAIRIGVLFKTDGYVINPTMASASHCADIYPPVEDVKPIKEPATFQAHGHVWTRHTPGDPCPVDGEARVEVIYGHELSNSRFDKASGCNWEKGTSIIGYRLADEPAQPPAEPWQPAVGDMVRLKSGGPKMTVCEPATDGAGNVLPLEWKTLYFNGGKLAFGFRIPSACLVSAKEVQP